MADGQPVTVNAGEVESRGVLVDVLNENKLTSPSDFVPACSKYSVFLLCDWLRAAKVQDLLMP